MERDIEEDGIQPLFEIFGVLQRLISNSLDQQEIRFTKYQLYLMMALASKGRMTMGQAAAYLGCSKEQATRLVTALAEAGYVERLHGQENRKLVFIGLTDAGAEVMRQEKEAARRKLKKEMELLSPEEQDLFLEEMKRFAGMLKRFEKYQERKKMEAENEIYGTDAGGPPAGGHPEIKVVR